MTFVEALAQTLAFTRNRDDANAQDLAEAVATADRWNQRRANVYGLAPFSDVSAPIRAVVVIDDEGDDDA